METNLTDLSPGTILSSNGKYLVIIAVRKDHFDWIETEPSTQKVLTDNNATIDGKECKIELNRLELHVTKTSDIPPCNVVGSLHPSELENLLRTQTLDSIHRYHDAIHAPKSKQLFVKGERITYAGRVFDNDEMSLLGESLLDFWLTSGRFCEQFERDFARFLGARFCAVVNSGSSANLLAFSSLTSPRLKDRALQPGDEVITVAAGFPTTVTPILQNGCIPVFLDITLEDGCYNIDVSMLEAAYSPRTKAVMLAHTLGNPFNLSVITEFCKKHSLWLVEDNCDALGSRYNGQYTGTFGDLATSSFYPPHHMTMGEGGAVYSKDLKFKKIVESFRDWGRDCWCPAGKDNTCGVRFSQQLGTLPDGYDHKYTYSHAGYNLKITDMQAAIGLAQLKKVDSFITARKRNWSTLREGCRDLEEHFYLPSATPNSDPSWFGFLLTPRNPQRLSRSKIISAFEERNIQTRMLFAGNLTRQPFLVDSAYSKRYRVVGDLSTTDYVMNNTFWVGVYPGLKPGMLEYILETLHEVASEL